ncbi:MAG: Ig-like domain-containing protein, partial [Acidobacteriota bacterium]
YQLLGNVPAGGSRFVTWYYAAAPLVNLEAVTASLGAAGAPGALAGNSQVTVTWTEPSTEQAITSYVIRYSSNNGTSWTEVPVPTIPNPLSQVVTGLVNGTTYIFQVAPVTAAGRGVFSNASPSVTPGLPANITPPTVRGGRPFVGSTLSVNDPNINWINNGSQAMTASYQWQANNVNIPGATGTTFAVTSAYLGQVIRVRASRTNEIGTTSVFSSSTLGVAGAPANYPPVPTDQTLSTRQGVARSVTLTGTDQENSSLTFAVTIQPSNGTLSGTAPNLTYTPNAGFTGTDFFLFRVNDGAQNSSDDGTITINVFPTPTQLALSTVPVPGASGASMTTAPAVSFLDAGGNVINGLNDPVTVSIQSGTGGTLGGTTTVNAFNGVATFNGLTLTGLVGTNYVLRFTDGSLTVDSGNITPSGPGAATRLELTTAPVAVTSGAAFSTQPVVTIRDAAGNPVTGTAAVTVAIQSGTGGVLGGTTTVNAVNGVATFTNLSLAGVVGTNYVLRFSATGLTPIDTASITPSGPGAATQLVLTTPPAGGASGTALSTQPVLTIRDSAGNTVTSWPNTVTVAVQSGAGGTVGGSTSTSFVNGVATFSGLTLAGSVGTSYVLSFTADGLTAARSSGMTVTGPGVATQLALTTAPVSGASGAAFATQPVLTVLDAAGNTVTSWPNAVTASILSGTGGTLGGTTSVTPVNGVATFSGLSLAGTVGTSYVLRFSSGPPAIALTVDTSSLTVTPGAATQLVLTTAPAGSASGTALTIQPVVTIRDAQGNTVTGSTAAVTVAISSGTGGTLGGTTTVSAVDGVATFSGLTLAGTVGTSYV